MSHIPVGLATKLGAVVAAVMGSATTIQLFLDGDHTEGTIATLAAMIVTIYKIMDGRYNQATAAVTDATSQVNDQPGQFHNIPADSDNSSLEVVDGDHNMPIGSYHEGDA